MKKILAAVCIISAVLAAISAVLYPMYYFDLLPRKIYSAKDFGIDTVKSLNDADNDGIDDYTDLMLSAREYLGLKPEYKFEFYDSGYPPEGVGMGADLIWKAFEGAGYPLKEMIDKDIAENPGAYPAVNGKPDPNVDFRRVRNLLVFFKRKAKSLTLDPYQIEQWQPGDIVVFDGDIAIVSDKRGKSGIPYILHLSPRPKREEDALLLNEILGHFRWEGILEG
ncbi:MAG TPA: DUF1287 domain-containing protein [Candidatus Avimonas sp.]|nr:DUF1287 domain-containing protein [Clostridiales bacterium]HPU58549.1 DUF1287 domain-containing protein [Candidatus Avimonas sp.]